MTSRPVVSYDDITLPYETTPSNSQPPPKKRKRNNHKKQPTAAPQHWDDPTPADEAPITEEQEGRELAYEEIWDDSALIQAWEAAMEEYEAYHGPHKGWKKDPVHKSPLWYNVPQKNISKKSTPTVPVHTQVDESDSRPIDFDTFVPTHDPSLAGAATTTVEKDDESEPYNTTPLTAQPHVSQDEAFERAVQASYWSGYWTAVYHTQLPEVDTDGVDTEQDMSSNNEEEEDGEFLSTQR